MELTLTMREICEIEKYDLLCKLHGCDYGDFPGEDRIMLKEAEFRQLGIQVFTCGSGSDYTIPKDCPKDYQGVGDERCWNCQLQKTNRCPYLEPEMLKIFNSAIEKKRIRDNKEGNSPCPWVTFDAEHLRKYLDTEIKEWAKTRSAVEESIMVSDEEKGELIDIINLACFIILKKIPGDEQVAARRNEGEIMTMGYDNKVDWWDCDFSWLSRAKVFVLLVATATSKKDGTKEQFTLTASHVSARNPAEAPGDAWLISESGGSTFFLDKKIERFVLVSKDERDDCLFKFDEIQYMITTGKLLNIWKSSVPQIFREHPDFDVTVE